jgi:hypothetical protein
MASGFEIASAFFAGISALADAVQLWTTFRDKRRAADTFDETFKRVLSSPQSRDAALELVAIVPEEVLADLEDRARRCWTRYQDVLRGPYLPAEVDEATESVQACVCRELKRIYQLNGDIPPRWRGQWTRYKCEQRP